MKSLFYVILMFSQLFNSCLFDACFVRTGLWSIVCFSFYEGAATPGFLIFYFPKVFLLHRFQIYFLFPYLYICVCVCVVTVLAIDLMNVRFLFLRVVHVKDLIIYLILLLHNNRKRKKKLTKKMKRSPDERHIKT